LTIGLWVHDGRPVHTDVVLVAEFQEFLAGELGHVVSDDGVGHPEPVDDVREEHYDLLCPEIRDWVHLDPLGELVNGDQQVGVAPERLSQGPDNVQPPHGKRPRDGDHLEGVRWEVGFAGIELAPFTGAHDLTSVDNCGRPVEALAKRVAHEGAWRRVVATHACVDVPEELAPLGDGYAACLYSSPSTRVNDFLHPGDASGLGPI
jgi:hypothetical protein